MHELTRTSHAWLPLLLALTLPGCSEETVDPLELNGPPDAIAPTGGDGQSAIVGTELPLPLSVQVTDADGAPAAPGVAGRSWRHSPRRQIRRMRTVLCCSAMMPVTPMIHGERNHRASAP
jgi:hypothetical protein